ncbi:MAG: phospho-N-acetylmuramoyl-pentapeptide-transferase [Planctomycetota bacterium]|jgi:phospho-N-acetylmuramoyl-pentapeptide-transferase
MWKTVNREKSNEVDISPAYKEIHDTHSEKKTPRIGGVIIWLSVLATVATMYIISVLGIGDELARVNFLSRNQTVLLVFGLIAGAGIGLLDDLMQIWVTKQQQAHGFSGRSFFGIVLSVGLVCALWFFVKLDMSSIFVPFFGQLELGVLFIPFFTLVMLGVFSSGVIDGLDGLAGGVFAIIFGAFGVIALIQNQIDISTFSFVVSSGILAFLWFNIPPARFYMGETGMLALTVTLTLIAFLTNQVLLLLIIGFPLVATALSSLIQIVSKRWFGVKVFKIAPLHHHFQAMGWSREKIVMRYWIISLICAIAGIVVVLIGQ